jgi:protein-disulfide isomerase
MRALLALFTALLLALPATAAPPKKPAAKPVALTDWSRTITVGTGGAYILGNPRARRLVEYVSYTCPHCAHFVAEASGPMKAGWVKRGQLSVEVRNAIRDPYDLTAAVLARCGGTARFFGDHEALFANQDAWMDKVQEYEPTRLAKPEKDAPAQLQAIADTTGLTAFMVKRGLSAAKQKLCLADKKALDLLAAMATDAWETKKIGGTPSFSLDGKLFDEVHDWAGLSTALTNAGLPVLPN